MQSLSVRMLRSALPLMVVLITIAGVVPSGIAQDKSAAGWQLVWSDEFSGEVIDRANWDFDLGDGFFSYDANMWISGWGNGELQYYTKEPENAFVANGMLHIRALRESFGGRGYTSARMKTRKRDGSPLFAKKYGRFEVRAKLPLGQGIWPAIWMMPQDDKYGTWAASGEIDILEAKGHEPQTIHGTIHFGGRWPANEQATQAFTLPTGKGIDTFHVYAVEWEPAEIRWYVDGEQYAVQRSWWSSSKVEGDRGVAPKTDADRNPFPAPFDQPFYLLLNLAVGGQFAGNPSKETPFPAEMLIDYVRVYDAKQR
jgi:beta-glucanase (GH16 family)